MSLAYKCDRCQRFIDKATCNLVTLRSEVRYDAWQSFRREEPSDHSRDTHLQLCDPCYAAVLTYAQPAKETQEPKS